jgi:hypothetical protein
VFDEKLGIPMGMVNLISCLGNIKEIQQVQGSEGRNASIADVVACLVKLGVNATGFIKGVEV